MHHFCWWWIKDKECDTDTEYAGAIHDISAIAAITFIT